MGTKNSVFPYKDCTRFSAPRGTIGFVPKLVTKGVKKGH